MQVGTPTGPRRRRVLVVLHLHFVDDTPWWATAADGERHQALQPQVCVTRNDHQVRDDDVRRKRDGGPTTGQGVNQTMETRVVQLRGGAIRRRGVSSLHLRAMRAQEKKRAQDGTCAVGDGPAGVGEM